MWKWRIEFGWGFDCGGVLVCVFCVSVLVVIVLWFFDGFGRGFSVWRLCILFELCILFDPF